MTKTDSRRYYPTALALYITYFVLGIAATIMGQYKQDFAALWGASKLADGSFDVSSVVAVIAAIGLGRLVAFPIAGPLSDRLGRRLAAGALVGAGLHGDRSRDLRGTGRRPGPGGRGVGDPGDDAGPTQGA